MEETEKTSRPRFLRQLGVTLAAALGVGVFAKQAFASTLCCWDSGCATCNVNATTPGHHCSCDCFPGCWNDSPCISDESHGCISCPC